MLDAEKYITYSVSVEKEVTGIDKNWEEITKTISYRLKFINSARFMVSSLTNLVNDSIEIVQKIKGKNCNTSCLKYTNV